MSSAFKILRMRCGLSQSEAARFLTVSESSIQSWDQGRRTAPPGVVDDLRQLYRQIESAAQQALTVVNSAAAGAKIEIGIVSDDHEAHQLGLPCVGAHEALVGLVIAWSDRPIKSVPLGSTTSTAGALQAPNAVKFW